MGALTLIIHIFVGATLGGSLVAAALVLGQDTYSSLLWVAAAGAVLSFPVSWAIARKISRAS